MTVTRNTGMDLLPFASRPSHPGARLRALQNARERREREAGPPDEAFDAARLARDLASVPSDVVLNGKQRDYLRRMGWTDERYARAQADLRGDQVRRVHATDPVTVTAAGAVGGLSPSEPAAPVVVASPHDLILRHATNALAAGTDPRTVERWTRQQLARHTWRAP